jgi:hypothetical protein
MSVPQPYTPPVCADSIPGAAGGQIEIQPLPQWAGSGDAREWHRWDAAKRIVAAMMDGGTNAEHDAHRARRAVEQADALIVALEAERKS